MTRGRKKDHSIPASRALVQQRDYRARRAQYLSDLESRCQRAEAENAYLRSELQTVRASPPVVQQVIPPETVKAAEELIHNLNAVSASVAHFKQLAVEANLHKPPSPAPSPTLNPWPLCPPLFTRKLPVPKPFTPTSTSFYRISRSAEKPPNDVDISSIDRRSRSPSVSLGDECCGGFIDCSELVEDEAPERRSEGDAASPAPILVRTSGLRSTSDGTP